MPKIKADRRKRKNGYHNINDRLQLKIEPQHRDEENTRYVKCSAQLFPHIVYVSELTADFLDRVNGSITFPESWCVLNIINKPFYVVVKSESFPLHSLNDIQGVSETEKWPYCPIISIWEKEHIQIENKVLFMSGSTFKKTKKMLRCRDSKMIRSVITHPDVRDVHEALTEMLETPIWEFLNEIKEKSQVPVTKPLSEELFMELDVLLNTIKHSSKTISQAKKQHGIDVPQNLKDYLSRKREVFGFGLWNQKEFCVFLNRIEKVDQDQVRHIQANLFRMYASFFETYTLKVVICRAQVTPYLSQGDKLCKPGRVEKYSTLGCFVKELSHVYAVTASHGITEGCIVATDLENHDQEKIGKCIFSIYDHQIENIAILSDVALIKIDANFIGKCHLSVVNHKNEDSAVQIYDGNLKDLVGKRYVYKIGATTSLRRGLIRSPDFTAKGAAGRAEVFIVFGVSGLPFAKEGDSGSIVFINENSSALDTIQVIGMVSGNTDIRDTEKPEHQTNDSKSETTNAREEENQVDNIFCYRFNTTLEILRKHGFHVSLENQV